MNKGLKSYTKQFTQKVGAATASVNLNKQDANIHIAIPLLSTKGLSPFSTSLIYNYYDRDQPGMFGNGVKLNFFSKVAKSGDHIDVQNADGSIDQYVEGVINNETQQKISAFSGSYQLTTHYEIEDKFGNKKIYGQLSEYPEKISQKSGDVLSLDFISSDKTISNGKGDVITFKCNADGKVHFVEYAYNHTDIASVILGYTGDELTGVEYLNEYGNTVAKTVIEYNSDNITLIDVLTDGRAVFTISQNRITKITDGFGTALTGKHTTKIEYCHNKTIVTAWDNTFVEYYFDSDGIPLYQIDSDGVVVETEFDSNTKLLTAQSSPFKIKGTQKNYFEGMTWEDFELTNVKREKVTLTDSKWKNILGETVYRFTTTGTGWGCIVCEVPIDCIATDNVTAILWGRQLTNYTKDTYVQVDFQIGDQDIDTFKKPIKDDNFELMFLGATCTRTTDKVRFFISFKGDVSIELGGLQIVKQDFGAFYQYDANNNATLISRCGENVKLNYNDNNMPYQVTDINTTIQTCEYNDKGQPLKSTSSYGVEIENEYSSAHPELLIKQKLSNNDKTKVVETQRIYSDDGRHISQEFDELGNRITSNSYRLDKLISICDALSAFTDFKYDSNGLIKDIILSKDNEELSKASYLYNDKRQLTSVVLKNGSKYDFVYDACGNITDIKLNEVVVFTYTYDIITGKVLSQKCGSSGDGYAFEYNDNHQISKVYYLSASGNKSLRFSYTYNNLKRLTKVTDVSGLTLASYEYDAEGNVISVSNNDSTISYSYDNLQTINNVSRTVGDKTISESFENVSRSQSVHPQKLLAKFSSSQYLGLLEKDCSLIMGNKKLMPYKRIDFVLAREGALPYLDLKANQTLAYQLKDRIIGNYELGCIKFWFKPTNIINKQFIFGVKSSKGNSYYSVYMQNSKLNLEICEENSKPRILLTSASTVLLNKWNFFALNFYLRDDGPSYGPNCEVTLTLNADTQFHSSTTKLLWIDVAPDPVYYIGHRYDGNGTSAFSGKIACISIHPRWNDTYENIKRYYTVTKDYIEDCQFIDASSQTLDASETVVFIPSAEMSSLFEVYPLHNSVKSISGKRPTKFTSRIGVAADKDKSFNFNNKIKRYAYVADGSELAYRFGQNNSGTILMRVYTEALGQDQYLFEGKDTNGKFLGLFRNASNKLCVNCNGQIITTQLTMSSDAWHTVALSFDRQVSQSSMSDSILGMYRVFIDGNTEATTNSTYNFNNLEFSIGRKFDEIRTRRLTGDSSEVYPLYGQIEMLCVSCAYCSVETLNTFMEEIKCITKTNEFDDFGMLKKSCFNNSDVNIMSKTVAYKTRTDKKYVSQYVASETFGFKTSTYIARQYEYDNAGNVTKIFGDTFGKHTYEYDGRGFLTKEDSTVYAYDSNGNITQMGSIKMSYDGDIKDRIVKVGNNAITYDANNPLNPARYKDIRYKFEGRRLVSYSTSSKNFTYKYNEQGLRIEKISHTGQVTKYIYDGNNLITELGPTYRLDFLYDENNLLYGFIKDGKDKYFYVRDFLQNIIGIVDNKGQLVVEYDQTAYGTVTVLKDLVGIANINPFRYKGYYYDSESGMYYCHTRYFVPEWGRWLNADDPKFLKKGNGLMLNLYAYSGNNPITNLDNSGRSWFSTIVKGLFQRISKWINKKIIQPLKQLDSTTVYARNEDPNTPGQILQGGPSFDEDFEGWGENGERTGWQKAMVVVAGIGVGVALVGVIVGLAFPPAFPIGAALFGIGAAVAVLASVLGGFDA